MQLPSDKFLILFDGYCALCNGAVKFILKFDRKKKFLFSPLNSETGTKWKFKYAIPEHLDSIVVITNDNYRSKSDAALFIAKRLGGVFHLARVFYGLPEKYRDGIYDWIATNRYRWFRKYESCMIPRPEDKDRFI